MDAVNQTYQQATEGMTRAQRRQFRKRLLKPEGLEWRVLGHQAKGIDPRDQMAPVILEGVKQGQAQHTAEEEESGGDYAFRFWVRVWRREEDGGPCSMHPVAAAKWTLDHKLCPTEGRQVWPTEEEAACDSE